MNKSNSAKNRLLLCTDMDRTIIPNGAQTEAKSARIKFSHFVSLPEISLAYVTGRNADLVKQAIKLYKLPIPDFAITDVGTQIYRIIDNQWIPSTEWQQQIASGWPNQYDPQLHKLLAEVPKLQLQESSKQSTYKLSYYVPIQIDKKTTAVNIQSRLENHKVNASLVWSIDEPKGIGLLDIIPKNATKLHAIEFIQMNLGYALSEIIFAGDSGNDLPVLTSPINSVLVANASTGIRAKAKKDANKKGNIRSLYCATGEYLNTNGNYAAGVLEGIWHFLPTFRKHLE